MNGYNIITLNYKGLINKEELFRFVIDRIDTSLISELEIYILYKHCDSNTLILLKKVNIDDYLNILNSELFIMNGIIPHIIKSNRINRWNKRIEHMKSLDKDCLFMRVCF